MTRELDDSVLAAVNYFGAPAAQTVAEALLVSSDKVEASLLRLEGQGLVDRVGQRWIRRAPAGATFVASFAEGEPAGAVAVEDPSLRGCWPFALAFLALLLLMFAGVLPW
jgi:hypothetical protein